MNNIQVFANEVGHHATRLFKDPFTTLRNGECREFKFYAKVILACVMLGVLIDIAAVGFWFIGYRLQYALAFLMAAAGSFYLCDYLLRTDLFGKISTDIQKRIGCFYLEVLVLLSLLNTMVGLSGMWMTPIPFVASFDFILVVGYFSYGLYSQKLLTLKYRYLLLGISLALSFQLISKIFQPNLLSLAQNL